jgi:epoxyqueuosine reductase
METDFTPRHGLDQARLLDLFRWTEAEFLERTRGSAIRRISFQQWQRNLAVALGNSSPSPEALAALERRLDEASALVREHLEWAIDRLKGRPGSGTAS